MRILAVADLHYSLRQFDWVRAQAKEFNRVIVAGDLLDRGSAVDPEVQAVAVAGILRRCVAGQVMVAASGNHDLTGEFPGGERAARWMESLGTERLRVDDQSWEQDGVWVSVCRGWEGPEGKGRMLARLEADAARAKRHWIWVHHNPADESPVAWTGRGFGGDRELSGWIRRWSPDTVVCGHVHHAPFYPQGSWCAEVAGAWVFNPGRQPGPVPTAIVLDLEARRAEWWSAEGVVSQPWPRQSEPKR